ncbi:MAG: DUF4160 domain-containing protein [Cytophagaceae bacterium]|nr:DUF4160 domain-containing protein [Cytophagaceae bacterium]
MRQLKGKARLEVGRCAARRSQNGNYLRFEVTHLEQRGNRGILRKSVDLRLMPTIYSQNGFRFFFFSNEHEPAHIRVEKGDGTAKFNLIPVTLVKNEGLKPRALKQVEVLIEAKQSLFLQK